MRPLIVALVILAGASTAYAEITGKPRVMDGDTIEVASERVRLHGIDAPEADQTCADEDGREWSCGQDAAFALANLIGDHWITCRGDERDKYGRLIAVCYAGDHDLNAKMGGGFMFFYVVIYGVLWLGAAIFGRLVNQDDKDASFFDGDGMH